MSAIESALSDYHNEKCASRGYTRESECVVVLLEYTNGCVAFSRGYTTASFSDAPSISILDELSARKAMKTMRTKSWSIYDAGVCVFQARRP